MSFEQKHQKSQVHQQSFNQTQNESFKIRQLFEQTCSINASKLSITKEERESIAKQNESILSREPQSEGHESIRESIRELAQQQQVKEESLYRTIRVEDDESKYEAELKNIQENYLKEIQRKMAQLYEGMNISTSNFNSIATNQTTAKPIEVAESILTHFDKINES